jgi:nitrogen fixation protein FixH
MEHRMNTSLASPPPLTGRKVLVMLLAFFGVVIGANLVMMRLAIQTLPGTEVDSAYSASLAYEREIAAARDQDARDWKVDAHIARDSGGGASVLVEARDHDGKPVSGLKFIGRFERPADRRADQPVALSEARAGIYRGSAASVAPGQWDLVLEAGNAGSRLFLSRNRVVLN